MSRSSAASWDGSAGAHSNLPAVIAVLRHAHLYAHIPGEIDEAIWVLERQVIRGGQLSSVAIELLPALIELARGDSPLATRVAEVVARYALAADSLRHRRDELDLALAGRVSDLVGWLGRHDRAFAAVTVACGTVRAALLRAVSAAPALAPAVLVALADLGVVPPRRTIEQAIALLDSPSPEARAAAAAFLCKCGALQPHVAERVEALLPAHAVLFAIVGQLWTPTAVGRPRRAPTASQPPPSGRTRPPTVVPRQGTVPPVNAVVQPRASSEGVRISAPMTAQASARIEVPAIPMTAVPAPVLAVGTAPVPRQLPRAASPPPAAIAATEMGELPPSLSRAPMIGGDPWAAALVGQLVEGKYQIDAILGAGGMGIVLAATNIRLGTAVAIKVLRREAAAIPEMSQRFLREARAASRLRSAHVCKALDVGQLPGGEPFIVMERLVGEDLQVVAKKQPLTAAVAARHILQACDALAEAHTLGMIHRDLKPANLFVTELPDGTPHVKVLDFGIATAATDDHDGGITRASTTMGSPSYMSPEQLRCAKSCDARSDVWSLGVTLYELLTGTQPFHADGVAAMSIAVAMEDHPRLPASVPAELVAIVDRCLRKNPAHRYQAVADLAAALKQFLAFHGQPRAQTEPVAQLLAARRWMFVAAGAAAAIAGAASALFALT